MHVKTWPSGAREAGNMNMTLHARRVQSFISVHRLVLDVYMLTPKNNKKMAMKGSAPSSYN